MSEGADDLDQGAGRRPNALKASSVAPGRVLDHRSLERQPGFDVNRGGRCTRLRDPEVRNVALRAEGLERVRCRGQAFRDPACEA